MNISTRSKAEKPKRKPERPPERKVEKKKGQFPHIHTNPQ